jgi:hypothetical protein
MKNFHGVAGIILWIVLPLTSCDRDQGSVTGKVEFYLVAEFNTVGERCAIDLHSVELDPDPLIWYAELLSYNPEEHIFEITDGAKNTIQNLEHSVFGVPFGVTADGALVYTGYFWPGYSSLSCQWIVIDPLFWMGGNSLRVELGYPGLLEGAEIPDLRNDPRILDIFRRDGKLVE